MSDTRMIAITDFLSEVQIKKAAKLGNAKKICEEITKPNITEINKKLEQENDPMYLAYAVEYALRQGGIIK